jgi:hypothetical protein
VPSTFVAPISPRAVTDAQFVRESLECAAVRKAADLATEDDIAELEAIDGKLGIDTKFAQLARWRTADHLVVMTPAGLLRPREVPAGWGLVEVDSRALKKGWEPVAGDPLPCTTRVAPSHLGTPETRRLRLLRNLAVAASRGVGYGLTPPRDAQNAQPDPAGAAATEPSLFSTETRTPSDTIPHDNLPR